eukprot:TRINITY_DN27129_c0_g1_i1.p2 TRINITY_DN27129_c0_g1~~TRINITY_DN27129_c0_g1_i1.p2  ORF type:complete len:121 (+),score=22.14 TRINITY_DN27129_c0_g1_i1:106-468(+)
MSYARPVSSKGGKRVSPCGKFLIDGKGQWHERPEEDVAPRPGQVELGLGLVGLGAGGGAPPRKGAGPKGANGKQPRANSGGPKAKRGKEKPPKRPSYPVRQQPHTAPEPVFPNGCSLPPI